MELLVVLLIAGGFVYLVARNSGYERAGQRTTAIEILASRGAKLLSQAMLRRAIDAFPDRRDALAPDAFAGWSCELMNRAVNSAVTEEDLAGIYRQWDHLLPECLRGDLTADERWRLEAIMEDAFLETMNGLSA